MSIKSKESSNAADREGTVDRVIAWVEVLDFEFETSKSDLPRSVIVRPLLSNSDQTGTNRDDSVPVTGF